VISTPQGARVESFAAARIVVGRSSECELNIPEVPELSRKHLSFSVMNGVLRVEDLGSRHGTFLNEMRVSMAVVPVGSRVRAATVCITVLDVEASAIPVSALPTQEPTLTLSAELIRECAAEEEAAAPPGYNFL
jgi:pSer/pThr/pTyr-binding forkhead associated (FHA) protein